MREFWKEFPLMYKLIIFLMLLAGTYGLITEPEGKKLEIVAEFKDTVVFDSARELPIIFLTD